MTWESDCRFNFFSPPVHLFAGTCINKISFLVTLSNKYSPSLTNRPKSARNQCARCLGLGQISIYYQSEKGVWVYWRFTSHATIFQSYMWRHRCAGGLKKKLDLRSGSQRHRHFAGFFNVSVLYRHGTTLFIRWFLHTAPFSRLLRHAGDTEKD